jgi:DhnA family fructose-bisphosphate aldolase class Ia
MCVEQLLKTKFICPIKILQTLFLQSNRNGQTIRSLSQLYNHGRMGGTNLSILPVDQGIEHTAGSSFTQIPYTLILKIA